MKQKSQTNRLTLTNTLFLVQHKQANTQKQAYQLHFVKINLLEYVCKFVNFWIHISEDIFCFIYFVDFAHPMGILLTNKYFRIKSTYVLFQPSNSKAAYTNSPGIERAWKQSGRGSRAGAKARSNI